MIPIADVTICVQSIARPIAGSLKQVIGVSLAPPSVSTLERTI
jgi:hypothetical protein